MNLQVNMNTPEMTFLTWASGWNSGRVMMNLSAQGHTLALFLCFKAHCTNLGLIQRDIFHKGGETSDIVGKQPLISVILVNGPFGFTYKVINYFHAMCFRRDHHSPPTMNIRIISSFTSSSWTTHGCFPLCTFIFNSEHFNRSKKYNEALHSHLLPASDTVCFALWPLSDI